MGRYIFNKMRENAIGAMTPVLIVCCKKTHTWFKFPVLNTTERAIEELLNQGKSVEAIIDDNKKGFSRANVFRVKKKLEVKVEKDKSNHY